MQYLIVLKIFFLIFLLALTQPVSDIKFESYTNDFYSIDIPINWNNLAIPRMEEQKKRFPKDFYDGTQYWHDFITYFDPEIDKDKGTLQFEIYTFSINLKQNLIYDKWPEDSYTYHPYSNGVHEGVYFDVQSPESFTVFSRFWIFTTQDKVYQLVFGTPFEEVAEEFLPIAEKMADSFRLID